MAFRSATSVVLALFTLIIALPASAGWHEFCQRSALDWKRANAWPDPFNDADHLAVCAPFVLMVENGWALQSTLTGYHFDPVSNQLTDAGRLKVQSILSQHPEAFRTIYVVQAPQQDSTVARMEAVKESIVHFTGTSAPDVRLTTIEPRGMPASEVQAISARHLDTIPDPRLPATVSTTNVSGGTQ